MPIFQEDRFSLVPLLQSTCKTRVLTRASSSLKYVEMIMNCLIIVWGLFFNALFFIGGMGVVGGQNWLMGLGKRHEHM